MDTGSRNSPVEDRKSAGCKDKDPVQEMDKGRGAIATLATMDGSTRRSKSPRMPTRSKDTEDVDGTGQGRKDSLEKRILAASQMAEVPESLRYPESRRSTSEDSVTQKEAEQSEKRTEPATNDDTTEPMTKAYIESVDINNDEGMSDMDMRLGYFGLGLCDQMEIPEADKLLEIVGQIEGRSVKILLDIGCSIYVLSSSFVEWNEISEIQMRPWPVDLVVSSARAQFIHKTASLKFRIGKTIITKSLYLLSVPQFAAIVEMLFFR